MKISGSWAPDGIDNDISIEVELRQYEQRDLFAAFALSGLLAQTGSSRQDISTIVGTAFEFADAMMLEKDRVKR